MPGAASTRGGAVPARSSAVRIASSPGARGGRLPPTIRARACGLRTNAPYTPEWFCDVLAGFLQDACGPRPLVGGHGAGALLALEAIAAGAVRPEKLILMPSPLHARPVQGPLERAGRVIIRAGAVPGCDR